VYDFHVDLKSPVLLNPNQFYWLSILSDASATNPLWAWTSGFGLDGLTTQDQIPGSRTVRAGDRAFSLQGTVPEPATLAFAGLAFVLATGRSLHRASAAEVHSENPPD